MAVASSANPLPLPRLSLEVIEEQVVDDLVKGIPPGASLRVGDVGRQGWHVLAGDMPLPLAVIRESVLKANSAWMGAFTAANGLLIAPHGKTTMAPQLFDLQIADGAWAITVGNIHQLQVARHFGCERIVLANQLVGRQGLRFVLDELQHKKDGELLGK